MNLPYVGDRCYHRNEVDRDLKFDFGHKHLEIHLLYAKPANRSPTLQNPALRRSRETWSASQFFFVMDLARCPALLLII